MSERESRSERPADYTAVFALLESGASIAVTINVAEIDETMQAIRELEEVTRQVDSPYVGTYLSV